MLSLFPLVAKAIVLSTDFKPSLPGERERIENAGRTVSAPAGRGNIERIDGEIAISRAIGTVLPAFFVLWNYTVGSVVIIKALLPYISGDLAYKNVEGLSAEQQAITAYPEVRTVSVTNFCR